MNRLHLTKEELRDLRITLGMLQISFRKKVPDIDWEKTPLSSAYGKCPPNDTRIPPTFNLDLTDEELALLIPAWDVRLANTLRKTRVETDELPLVYQKIVLCITQRGGGFLGRRAFKRAIERIPNAVFSALDRLKTQFTPAEWDEVVEAEAKRQFSLAMLYGGLGLP
jgi:hypothetical protein